MIGMTQSPLPIIGIVRSRYADAGQVPIQAQLNRDEPGVIEFRDEYRDGLDGLGGFDYAWLITWLHLAPDDGGTVPPIRQTPFLLRGQQRTVGMFACRTPWRVNPIGLSLIRIVQVAEQSVRFAGVDVIDGTPVLDLKPYVARFDQPEGKPRCGWYDEIAIADHSKPAELPAT
jgi:tRNA-Thr(GGU) m(6)t(6)A37 methyltransferase TsaA